MVSPNSAIRAAQRYFDSTDVRGLTWAELTERLAIPESFNRRSYGEPFHIPDGPCYILRFDNGNYGVQYELYVNSENRIYRVEERYIE